MSVPALATDPSPFPSFFQLATPFNYVISNSAPYYPLISVPTYTTGLSNAASNTNPYSPNDTLLYTTGLPNSNITSSGIAYATSNLVSGAVFEFTLPYPSTGMAGTGSMYFITSAQATFSNIGYNVQIASGTYYSYTNGDSVQYTYNGGNSFGVLLKRSVGGNISLGPYTASTVQFNMLGVTWPSAGVKTSVEVKAPDLLDRSKETYPYLAPDSLTTPELLQYISGSGTTQLTFATAIGFQSILTAPTLQIVQTVAGVVVGTTPFTFSVQPLTITATPIPTNPLLLSAYQPFYYTYSIPDNVVGVTLKVNSGTSPNLLQYISDDASTFSSSVGLTVGGTSAIRIDAILNGNTILTNSSTDIIVSQPGVIVTPPIPTGSLSLYKYEPFSYTFTLDPLSQNLTLQFTNSSSELQAFCTISADKKTVTFAGTFLVSYAAVLSLKIDLLVGGSVVGTTIILISVGPGRFFEPVLNKNYQLFQYEDISNTFGGDPSFSTIADIDSIVSTPGLPTGLYFVQASSNLYYLHGIPLLQTAQSNYQVIGSNSSNGRIVTTTVSIKVNGQLVRISPNTATISNLAVGTAIEPVTFTATQPQSIYGTTFIYSWSSLPDGFSFQFPDGNNVSQYGTPKADVVAVLVGTPTIAFANGMKSANSYQTRLYGTQSNNTGGGQLSGSALITFSFGETVLIDVSNSIPLYTNKPLGPNDFIINAGSYFSTYPLSSITASSLPPGLSLSMYANISNYHLTGTPTTANLTGSYTFTASNTHGVSRSITVTLPVNPNVVTFSGTPPSGSAFNLIVSKPLINSYPGGLKFSATSAASTQPLVYSSSIVFTDYGLIFNTSTGEVTGIPTGPLPTTPVTIYATDQFGAIGSTTIQLTIASDVFTWPAYSPVYFQNLPITPFLFVMGGTNSGRTIQSYSSADLPSGLILNPSGLLTGAATIFVASGTFHVTATTGYSTLTQEYTYTMVEDSLLIIEVGGPTTVTSVHFSNVLFETIQYSKNAIVNPTYTVTNILPLQASNMPTLSVSSSGVMTGDFTNGLVSSYTAVLTASYENASGSTPVSINFTPLSVPIMVAAYNAPYVFSGVVPTDQIGYVRTTNSYVFPERVPQTWDTPFSILSNATEGPYTVVSPEISRLGLDYVVGGSDDPAVPGFYNGRYSPIISNIVWTPDELEPYDYSGVAAYPGVANDGVNTWVVISLPYQIITPDSSGVWTRIGGGGNPWTMVTRITTTIPTLGYMSPNFILGNSGLADGYDCNAHRIQFANQSDLTTWTTATTLPAFSNVLRFTTSNTRIVAMGSAAPTGVCPLAYSDDQGSNWATVESTPARLTGGNVIINDLLFANNKWVMVGLDSNSVSFIAYADDLSNWSFYSGPPPSAWSAIAFNGNGWTIAGASNAYNGEGYVSVSKILSLDTTPWPTQAVSSIDGSLFVNFDPLNATVFKTSRLISAVYPTTERTGVVSIPNLGNLTFLLPDTQSITLYQYVPYSIPIQAAGTSDFIYYYVPVTPVGFTVTTDENGVLATLSGISPSNNTNNTVTVYAKTATGYASAITFSLTTITPFFVKPQLGAAAFTALLRNEVEANAAQNARDQRVFPQVDPLAGPYMGPRAPDVVTPDDCFLKLCKKPCPTCRS